MNKPKEFSKETFKVAVQRWVELMHFNMDLGQLVEDSDEVGEIFEFENWLKDPDEQEYSIMGMHVAIEEAAHIAYKLYSRAEQELKKQLKHIAKNDLSESIFDKKLVGLTDESIEGLFECIVDDFQEIYDYNSDQQFENFKNYLNEINLEELKLNNKEFTEEELMLDFNNQSTRQFTPVLKNNNSPREWAKFAYAIFQSGYYKPECSFYNYEDSLKMPAPGFVFPSNFYMFSLKEENAPKDYQTFIDIFNEYQPNGASLVFSTTVDDKNRLSVMFPPDGMYNELPKELRAYMPMVSSFCSNSESEKAMENIMEIYDKL